jgi:predicted glycoside hydrolase/deacetylase ChbG (UPF0249 family)
MQVQFHADDFCLTKKISSRLLEISKKGRIGSVSCIVNTIDIVPSLKKISKLKKKIKLHLHLNLIDGKPLSKNLKKIVDSKNYFNMSFIKLFLIGILPGFSIHKLEIEKEIEQQIKYFLKCINLANKTKKNVLYLDSHLHIHTIPWLLDIILKLRKKYNIVFIRSLDEPFILSSVTNFSKFWFYKNIIKFVILKSFNIFNKKKLLKNKINTNKFFFGIINSGYMDQIYVKKVKKFNMKNSQILIHPVIADKKEHYLLGKKEKIYYFLSKQRSIEQRLAIK